MADGVHFLRGMWSALQFERRPSDAVTRLREVRLRSLLDRVAATPRGRERLSDVDFEAPLLPQLERIPPVDKSTMMADFEGFVAPDAPPRTEVERWVRGEPPGRFLDGRYLIATTSGTTGEVGFFVFDRRSWSRLRGALMARIIRHRLIPREVARFSFGRRYRMAMVAATGGPYITYLVAAAKTWGAGLVADVRAFPLRAPPDELREGLEAFDPHYLHGYPSVVEGLAEAKARGELNIDPEFISLGSEPLGPRARARIQSAFEGAELCETYGATEHVAMATACRFGALHVNEDLCILEARDARGAPVPPGVPSDHVLVTNLFETAQPILRYRLDDAVTVLEDGRGPCPCGCAFAQIEVQGRSDDVLLLEDGQGRGHRFPPVPFEVLCLETQGVRRYQLVHEAQNQLRLLVVPQGPQSDVAERISRRFDEFFASTPVGGQVQLQVELVEEIPRMGGGAKLRQVWSKVPAGVG